MTAASIRSRQERRQITERKRAEAALRQSEERFRGLTGLSSDMYWEQDEEYRFTALWGKTPQWLRRGREGMVGRRRWDEHYLNMSEADWAAHRATLDQRLPFHDLELCRRNDAGLLVWVSVSGEPVFDPDGKFRGYRGVGKDVTERKRAEQLLRLEHDIALMLSEVEDARGGLKAVLRAVCESEGWAVGRYFRVDEEAGLLRFEDAWHVPQPEVERFAEQSRDLAFRVGEGLAGIVWQTGEPLWSADTSRDARVKASSLARSTGIRGAFAFALVSEGKIVGVLAFSGTEVRELDQRLLQAARIIGGQVGQFLKRTQAEDALRESEARFRALTALGSDWYWEQDEKFRFTAMIGEARRRGTTGLPVPEHFGKTRWELPALNLTDEEWAKHRAALERHEPFRDFEIRRPGRDGKPHWASVSGEPVFDAEGRFRGYRGIGRDITEKKLAELRLRASEERFRGLVELSSDWYWELDAEFRFTTFERRGQGSGYQPTAMLGKIPWEMAGLALDPAALEKHRERHLRHEAYRDFEYCYRTRSGKTYHMRVNGEPTFDADGRFTGYRGVSRDVTEAKRREEELLRFRAAMDMSGDLIMLVDRASMRYLDANETACRLLGYSREELLTMRPEEVVPGSRAQLERLYDSIIAGAVEGTSGTTQLRCRDGSLLPVDYRRHALELAGRWIIAAVSRDARPRLAAEDELRRFRLAMDNSADMIVLIDRATMRFVDVNDTVCRLLGYSREEMLAKGPQDVLPVAREELERAYDEFIAEPSTQTGMKSHYICKDGSLLPFESTRRALRSGEAWLIAAISRDIRERVAAEEELRKTSERLAYLAQFDELTRLPNRSLLRDRLEQAIVQARRRNRSSAVLFVDLDRFKLVNDTLGHAAGDELLAETARRLGASVREGDAVGRISGDEFAVVLADLAKPEDAELVARKVLAALAARFVILDQEAFVSASIGIAIYPGDGTDAETLLGSADVAMYRAKESGRNTLCFFTAELNERAATRMRLTTELRRALERREFRLHYQPKFDIQSGSLTGVEALLRWQHPERGLVAPGEFVPVLEETGLIVPTGEWVLEEACRQLMAWDAQGLAIDHVAVNISARQFRDRGFVSAVRTITQAAGVEPRRVELEITESYLMDDPEAARRILAELRAAGLRIAMDDFGTGYSSLSYLTGFPLSALKIDRSFVAKLGQAQSAEVLVRAIIDLAHNLRLVVVAEGIETERQLELLRALGCDQAQGYLLGRPSPADAIPLRRAN